MPKIVTRSKPKSPKKLSTKLLEIRLRLNESQNGILKRLELDNDFDRGYISKWERGLLEPPLYVLCAYADLANIYLDVLARDSLELPLEIPSKDKSAGLKLISSRIKENKLT